MSLPIAGLATCLLGCLLCPIIYLEFGFMSGFSNGMILLVPTLAGIGHLIYRLLLRPSGRPAGLVVVAADVISMILVTLFLFVVSGARLSRGWDRIGWFCMSYLIACGVALLLVYACEDIVAQRLGRVPDWLAATVSVVILATATALYVVSLYQPTRFL